MSQSDSTGKKLPQGIVTEEDPVLDAPENVEFSGVQKKSPEDLADVDSTADKRNNLRSGQRNLQSRSCGADKSVRMYKFCINGDCDAGANGEHKLRLDGQNLSGDFVNFREGQCHNLNYRSVHVNAYKSMTVGTEEHDDWSENDSYFTQLPASKWYDPTCAKYEIVLSKEFDGAKEVSMCYSFGASGINGSLTLDASVERCERWTEPAESFVWFLEVSPSCFDSPAGWYDRDGPDFNCAWYAREGRCAKYGNSYTNFGKTAKQACCSCK